MKLLLKMLEAIDFHYQTAIITTVVIVFCSFAVVGLINTFKKGK
jgi:hypothetical protein